MDDWIHDGFGDEEVPLFRLCGAGLLTSFVRQPGVEVEDAADFLDALGVLVCAMAAGDDFFGDRAVQVKLQYATTPSLLSGVSPLPRSAMTL